MDFSKYEVIENAVILRGVKSFDPRHIFDCGQCFRWNKADSGNYIGVAFNRVLEVEKAGDDVILRNCTEADFNNIWLKYFDLNRSYGEIKSVLSEDPTLREAVEFGQGIRLLQQEPFEMLISFIISSNNRIPMIKRCIDNISKSFGNKIMYKGQEYYSFPTIEELSSATVEELKACGAGFRDKYIFETTKAVFDLKETMELKSITSLNDDGCHQRLQDFSGVGPKVADCIMLFSMNKYSAFPVDVWVKRAMQHFYCAADLSLKKIRDFGRDKFGELSGFAQQYLFFYARETGIKL